MDFLKLIKEGRVDDFKSKYGNKFSAEQLKRLIDSVSPKYLMWVGKTFDGINFEDNFPKLYTALNNFTKVSTNLPKTDINQYKDLEDLINTISVYENRERRDVKKVEGGNVVYDDGKLFVVNPLDYKASCYYGRGTKWCTAAETDTHFNKYNEDGKLFYIIDRTKPTSDPLYKVAFLRKFDGEKTFYDAKDEYVKTGWIFSKDQFKKIESEIDNYLNSEYSEQIKIFTDKELARKEKERLHKLEIQRILNQRRQEAEERRLNGEWDLENDPPLVGLKAYALLKHLTDNGEVEILTNEDRLNIQNINDELEELRNEYERSRGERHDLSARIDELEDELNDYETHIDVYNIIPVGKYYEATEFEVIDSNVEDNRYAVGTDSEMQSSCEEYVEQLIDDIGYEGFAPGFARQYLNTDSIAEYAYETYDSDVRDNPDSYLDENDRLLSDEQEEQIEFYEKQIVKINDTINKFESQLGKDDDTFIENKIQELNQKINDYESEIEDIKESPEGDFPEDLIEEKVDELVSEVKDNPEWFLSELGLDWNRFVDKDDFIQGVIDADGYGHTINSYNGSADEVYLNDELFYVMRID